MSFLLKMSFILFGQICIIIAEHAIGDSCTPATGGRGDCADTNAICPASGICECNDGFNGQASGTCAKITQGKVNAECDNTKTCAGTHVTCEQTFCKCTPGFTANKGEDDCIPEHTIGSACTPKDGTKADCSDDHAICPTTGRCECKAGYSGFAGETCTEIKQGKVNAACDNTKTCTGTHVTCELSFCKCTPGFTANRGEDDCVAEHKIGATCTPSGGGKGDCADINAVCSAAGKCECKDGFNGPVGGECIAEHKIGATCTPSGGGKGDCADINAVCSAAGKCECKDGFNGPVGGDCTGNNQTGDNKGRASGNIFSPLLFFLAPVSMAVFVGQ